MPPSPTKNNKLKNITANHKAISPCLNQLGLQEELIAWISVTFKLYWQIFYLFLMVQAKKQKCGT
jgi:hypothetical protein